MPSQKTPDDGEVVKTLRLSTSLAREAETHAKTIGLTLTDLIEIGLRQQVRLPPNQMLELLMAVADELKQRFPDRKGFPQDVTLGVFRRIRADKALWDLYQLAILGSDGKVSDEARGTVHRRIGKTVKAVLHAEVIGRSIDLDPRKELINTHALLAPRSKGRATS